MCRIIEFTIEPTPIGEVEAIIHKENDLLETNVDMEMGVKYQYLKILLAKITETSKDDNFKRLIIAYSQNFNIQKINDLIYMCLACLTIPKFLFKYGFLLNQFKSKNVQEILEVSDMRNKLDLTTKIFSEFYNKIDLWERLEDEYDVKKEKAKATEKLQSIYESLKSLFENDKDEKLIQLERFKKNLEGKKVPEHIMKIIKEEFERFASTDKHSMESNVIRNYLDILTSLPYGISTEENLDIDIAKKILNETHYGMEDVKERILECIAVGKLKGNIQGKIICFVGPPGVGVNKFNKKIIKNFFILIYIYFH
jgi:Lon-like ATP-dependent protease